MDQYSSIGDMTTKDYTIGYYNNGVAQLRNKSTGEYLYTWPEGTAHHFPPVSTYEEAADHVKE